MSDQNRPTLLDLFCGAGGAAMGYHRAGFQVVGVDHRPQPNYPFEFVQEDALYFLKHEGGAFDVVHASPPCKRFSSASFCRPRNKQHYDHPDLLTPCREILMERGGVWVIENVYGAPLMPGPTIMLCGLTFGLKVFRHRYFESSHFLWSQPHISHGSRRIGKDGFCCVAGHGDASWRYRIEKKQQNPEAEGPVSKEHRRKAAWEKAMGIDWMTRDELSQAVPPAYTEYLGRQLKGWVTDGPQEKEEAQYAQGEEDRLGPCVDLVGEDYQERGGDARGFGPKGPRPRGRRKSDGGPGAKRVG